MGAVPVSAPVTRPTGRPAKGHTGRQRKSSCPACGFIAYASASAYRRAGMPVCGCGVRLQLANLRDIAELEPERLDELGERSYHAAMRELGMVDEIHAKQPPRLSKQPQCTEPGCTRFRKRGSKRCTPCEGADTLPF